MGRVAPLVAFSQFPTDWRTACIAVLSAEGDPRRLVEQSRQLGTPIVFVCYGDTLQWWKQGTAKAEWLESVELQHIPRFFQANQDNFSPDAVYRAKTLGRFRSEYQLSFVDHGLMPLVEEEVGTKLSKLIERNVSGLKKRIGWTNVSSKDGHWLIQTVFWLVSGKVLRDKEVPSFQGLDITDVDDVFELVAEHYGSQPVKVGSELKRKALKECAKSIEQFASLELTTTEALAYVYENTLISKATRSPLGTHSTPSYLVDYIVGNLADWIEEIPENRRSVYEPACGHAAFLISAMRLLSELLPHDKQIPSRRGPYLRSRLHGTDLDPFALELARLSLTLTDIPNPDGWDLRDEDMFVGDRLNEQIQGHSILLANPPFANFTEDELTRYGNIRGINKATEMLRRTLPELEPGGVFGIVIPQTVLHGAFAKDIRRFMLENFELREITLFPDKVFSFSDAESAVLLGRRLPQHSRRKPIVRFQRIRERQMPAFRESYSILMSQYVEQSRFDDSVRWDMRVPDLADVWNSLDEYPILEDIAEIGIGLVYHGSGLPSGSQTYSKTRFAGAVRGFVRFEPPALALHEEPTLYWMNLDDNVISRRRAGTTTGVPQVVFNYAPVSRGPWRLKALIDRTGRPFASRFLSARPRNCSLEVLWALLNSPVANAYAYCHLGKRDNTISEIRKIPTPDSDDFGEVEKRAVAYLEAAARKEQPSKLRRLLSRVDSAVLSLYGFNADDEQSILELFTGYERVGVPFTQDRYFPTEFTYPVSLAEFLDFEKDWPTTNRIRGKLIDKDIEGTISADEKNRLDALQAYADYYLEKTTPRPTEVLDKLESRVFAAADKKGKADR